MMRMNNIQMTSTVDRVKLLETLKANRASHTKIVVEAIAGYIEQAKKAVARKLDELQKTAGKLVHLQFNLVPPVDYSQVYDTAIAMLEWSEDETIELGADEFRQLVLDQWGWSDQFFTVNKVYSETAAGSSPS